MLIKKKKRLYSYWISIEADVLGVRRLSLKHVCALLKEEGAVIHKERVTLSIFVSLLSILNIKALVLTDCFER